jgi:hypothetical protein
MGRARPFGAGMFVLACLGAAGLAACSSPGTSAASSARDLSWAPGVAQAADGSPPVYSAASVCGSSTRTYLAELANGNPLDAKVPYEWADIVPGGTQILVSGTAADTHLGPQDNPFTHPFGNDLSMDVALDSPFRPFSRQLGPPEEKPGQMHVEIVSGVIPHTRRPSQASPAQTWEQLSNFNQTGFQPGFARPAVGDRVLVQGRWIIDCGHGNYGTELHPMSFLAWTQHRGSTTVARAYGNSVYDTQTYSESAFGGTGAPQPFPAYFVSDVLAATQGNVDHLSASEIESATVASPPPWRVCAPAGSSGRSLAVHYDVVARPGVDVGVAPDPSTGCATVTVSYGPAFRPVSTDLRQCVLPWSYVTTIAQAQYGKGLDVKGLVDKFVTAPAARAIVDRSPTGSCADALAGPTVNPAPPGRHVHVDGAQPIPFYGVVTVGWH